MNQNNRQVICMGDGGMDGNNPLTDLYILAQSKKKEPKICFLPTASGDHMGLVKDFLYLFGRYPCKPSVLTLFSPHTPDISSFIMEQDIIYVGGGQSKSMLGVWKEWNMPNIFRAAYANGTILAGGSAGSVCWFDQCITDSIPGTLSVMNCLGILPYSNCPHYASQRRRYYYTKYLSEGAIKPGYAADDFAAIHFVNEKYFRSVSSAPYAKVWKVCMEDGKAAQKRLKTRWLGLKESQEELIWSSELFASLKRENETEE